MAMSLAEIEREVYRWPSSHQSASAALQLADTLLTREGYHYSGSAKCTCPNGGEYGHRPTCGYVPNDGEMPTYAPALSCA